MFDEMLNYRYKEYRVTLYTERNYDDLWISMNGSDIFTWLPERDDHVMGVEGAAYKARYRPVQTNSAMAKLVVSTILICLYSLYL
jgi:hypothetical protein